MTDGLHRDVGAYVMGALDADEREAFEAHLAGCERCQADVVAFAPVPGLLARVDIAELEEARPSDPTPVLEAARAHVGGLARSRRRPTLSRCRGCPRAHIARQSV